ncbi:hypothetical protein GPY51_14395 [Photorhabdus laumondii subsp. laumondii]|uniref:Uncharacterized protein n=1 Tax=Photorhabdus laumondii subsp. laumondii TaxID=141679 RepID=A0A6L9JPL4_PHOLM|nr:MULTISPECIES: hypothetical protein [Photorhabdus]MCC8384848.1 hypothetical protein [Photorhabdus laumondii]MCC8389234.1 hypothetical protein [Photorhabdus laumondii]MCC8414207.1 hypothetical protein [Photorhabdus laumondii]NDK95595.1 hypothetical protein [Photorhabdus laumondii subsp. laumondii]NDL17844.1 hypothetical protein [Photorhabdus laumondii subsp. laumondii]
MMTRSALKKDKQVPEYPRRKIDELGDPLLALDLAYSAALMSVLHLWRRYGHTGRRS